MTSMLPRYSFEGLDSTNTPQSIINCVGNSGSFEIGTLGSLGNNKNGGTFNSDSFGTNRDKYFERNGSIHHDYNSNVLQPTVNSKISTQQNYRSRQTDRPQYIDSDKSMEHGALDDFINGSQAYSFGGGLSENCSQFMASHAAYTGFFQPETVPCGSNSHPKYQNSWECAEQSCDTKSKQGPSIRSYECEDLENQDHQTTDTEKHMAERMSPNSGLFYNSNISGDIMYNNYPGSKTGSEQLSNGRLTNHTTQANMASLQSSQASVTNNVKAATINHGATCGIGAKTKLDSHDNGTLDNRSTSTVALACGNLLIDETKKSPYIDKSAEGVSAVNKEKIFRIELFDKTSGQNTDFIGCVQEGVLARGNRDRRQSPGDSDKSRICVTDSANENRLGNTVMTSENIKGKKLKKSAAESMSALQTTRDSGNLTENLDEPQIAGPSLSQEDEDKTNASKDSNHWQECKKQVGATVQSENDETENLVHTEDEQNGVVTLTNRESVNAEKDATQSVDNRQDRTVPPLQIDQRDGTGGAVALPNNDSRHNQGGAEAPVSLDHRGFTAKYQRQDWSTPVRSANDILCIQDHPRRGKRYFVAYLCVAKADLERFGKKFHSELTEWGFPIFLPEKDLLASGFHYENLCWALDERCQGKIIIVLSKNFESSAECRFITQYARCLDPDLQKRNLIPVVIDKSWKIPRSLEGVILINYHHNKRRGWLKPRIAEAVLSP